MTCGTGRCPGRDGPAAGAARRQTGGHRWPHAAHEARIERRGVAGSGKVNNRPLGLAAPGPGFTSLLQAWQDLRTILMVWRSFFPIRSCDEVRRHRYTERFMATTQHGQDKLLWGDNQTRRDLLRVPGLPPLRGRRCCALRKTRLVSTVNRAATENPTRTCRLAQDPGTERAKRRGRPVCPLTPGRKEMSDGKRNACETC